MDLELPLPVATYPLPLRGYPPVSAAVLERQLHVLVMNHDGRTAAHLAVDGNAQVVATLPDLPLMVLECAGGAGELLVTAEDASGQVWLVALDARGQELWRSALHANQSLTRAPLPLCAGSRAVVIWEAVEGEDRALFLSEIHERHCAPPHRLRLPGTTHRLEAVLAPSGLILARLAGFPPALSLARIDADGHPTASVPVAEAGAGPVALAPAGEGIGLAWAGGDAVRVRRFNADLQPLGSSMPLHPAAGPVDRLQGYGPDRPAFVSTRWKGKPAARGQLPAREAESHVLLPNAVQTVPLPIGWIETGGWLGERFILVHGDGPMAASAFRWVNHAS